MSDLRATKDSWMSGPLQRVLIPPVVAYKHVDIDFAEDFRSGKAIQVGTFESYRDGEGDRVGNLEGIVINTNRHFVANAATATPEQMAGLRAFGVDLGEHAKNLLMVGNRATHRLKSSYIFRSSTKPDWSRISRRERIFRIADVAFFGHLLSASRPDILGKLLHGIVKYESRIADAFDEGVIYAHPLRKSKEFEFENEYRIVWEPGVIKRPREIVNAPRVARLIHEVTRR